jgi:hypothetical protein
MPIDETLMKEAVGRALRSGWVWWVAVLALAYAVVPATFALDDAYISLHSARVLLAGTDPAFGVPALVGATSPPYVALLALLVAVHLPALRLATALGIATLVAGLWRLGRVVGLTGIRSATLTAVVLVSGLVFLNVRNGLETGWAVAALIWSIVFALGGDSTQLAIVAGLLPAVRPDLAPAAALVLLFGLRSRSWSERARLAGIAALVAAPWFFWIRLNTGHWLPQTMEAKRYWYAEGCQPLEQRLSMAGGALGDVAMQLLPCAVALPWLWRSGVGRIGLVTMSITVIAYLWMFPGGLYHNHYRYAYVLLLPWGALALMQLGAWLTPSAGFVALSVVATLYAYQLHLWTLTFSEQARVAAELQATSTWIRTHLPESGVVLVHDAGAVSEFADRPFVDMVGLKTPASIASHRRYTWTSCGADRIEAVAEVARRSGAAYLVVLADWARIFQIPTGLKAAGFDLTTVRVPSDPDKGYYVFAMGTDPARSKVGFPTGR